MPESIVLLHGFGGTHRAWDGVLERLDPGRYLPVALDLPGHGQAPNSGRPISFSGCVEDVLARSPERFSLCGYSMGGRIALALAIRAPERVGHLVLVSTTAGIDDPSERALRRASDERLAVQLETVPFEDFIESWRTQPLFADEPSEVGALARADQRCNRPDALAAALRGAGTGQMEPLWGRLGELEMPVMVVVGERDAKFRALGGRMVALLANARLIVVPGGHNLPLESPAAIAEVIS